jgi:hypothetical protein
MILKSLLQYVLENLGEVLFGLPRNPLSPSSLSALSVLGRFCPGRDFLAGAGYRTHFDPERVVV